MNKYEKEAVKISMIAEPAEVILSDERVIEKMNAMNGAKGVKQFAHLFGLYGVLLSDELREHTFELIAGLKDMTVDEVKAQEPETIKKDIKRILDADVMGFFK